MNEERLLLKGKLGELSRKYLELKSEGTVILKQLSKGLNLHLHNGEISDININEVNALANRLNSIHEEVREIKNTMKEIEEELR
ncbi:MAG: hypothetical protein BWY64_01216 [bacterium ADurb.Bin363]|nr:MAG: hypothetical protein BWY64_01216 [bacterium ADurb.Bin363]